MNDLNKLPSKGNYDVITIVALAVGFILAIVGFIVTFTIAPMVNGAELSAPILFDGGFVTNQFLFSQKIFYFHVPVAVVSMVALAFTAVFGILFLVKRKSEYDLRAVIATEVALVFVLMTMVSGEMWERFEWGVWWTWEPRLTTYFILMLLVIGYFILRGAIDDPERRAVYSSVFGIITFVDVPICFMVTRLIPSSIHPVIFRTDSGLSPNMLIPFLLCMFGMLLIGFGLYRFRLRQKAMEQRVEAIKKTIDD
jgi:heme exporter protein C